MRYSSLDARAEECPEYVRITQGRSRSATTTRLRPVVVETLTGLAAEALGAHHARQQRCRRVVGVAELGVQRLEDRQARVETDQVEQRERPHREVAAALHRGVDVVARRDARVEHPHRVVEVREEQRVDDEAGLVADLHGLLAARLRERDRGGDRLVRRRDRPHHLDERHRGRGVEEVDAADAVGAAGLHRQLDDGQRRRVRREHRRLAADAVEVVEEVLLQREVFDDRLEHEVAVGELAEVGDRTHAAQHLRRGRPASMRPLSTWRASDFSSPATSASALDCARLRTTTSNPAFAHTSARPEPMIPDPTIPTLFTVMAPRRYRSVAVRSQAAPGEVP